MKKIILTLFLIVCAGSAHLCAQFKRGTFMAGGSISGDWHKDRVTYPGGGFTNDTYTQISFQPQAGYFLIDNFAVGAGVGLTRSETIYKAFPGKSITTDRDLSVFARYYYQYFFGQIKLQTGSEVEKEIYSDGSSSKSKAPATNGWNIGVGYACMLNKSVALEPLIGYGVQYTKDDSNDHFSYPGFFLQVGFQFYLKR